MKLRLLVVGRLRQAGFQEAVAEYRRRLEAYFPLELVEVRDGKLKDKEANLAKEAQDLLDCVRPNDYLVLLDNTGSQWDSPGLAKWLEMQESESLVFAIGSSYGFAQAVRTRANRFWSLSPLTFPHELARVIVLEQLYRAATIRSGHPYHHG
jgi:23S rRNA (pseudouridine1915-N3)-methyltransferase